MGLYFMLIAGGGTGNSRDEDGAFTFVYYMNRNKED